MKIVDRVCTSSFLQWMIPRKRTLDSISLSLSLSLLLLLREQELPILVLDYTSVGRRRRRRKKNYWITTVEINIVAFLPRRLVSVWIVLGVYPLYSYGVECNLKRYDSFSFSCVEKRPNLVVGPKTALLYICFLE